MSKACRIQRKRVKGFRLQDESHAINGLPVACVTRPGKYGNPFKVGIYFRNISGDWNVWTRGDSPHFGNQQVASLEQSLKLFEEYAIARARLNPKWLENLRGKNIACWCKEGAKCHGDIILRLLAESDKPTDQQPA